MGDLAFKPNGRRKELIAEPRVGDRAQAGFTLLELFVVAAMLIVLTSLLVPAMARTQPRSRSFQCLDNHRRLCAAWQMYAEDNRGRIPYASDDGTGTANPLNRFAWTQYHLDTNPNNRMNWDVSFLAQSPLWLYTGPDAGIFRCPADKSYVVVGGVPRPRVRSVAMNLYLGGFLGTDGGWPQVSPYRIYFRTSEIGPSPPSQIFVFLDFRPEQPGWANFMTDMTGYSPRNPSLYSFMDFPGIFHSGGCTFSFADNHVETKRWHDPRTMPRFDVTVTPGPPGASSPNNVDVAWLQDHSSRLR